MRGRVLVRLFVGGSLGIIPAGAGKRPRTTRRTPACQDHPRGCGEEGGALTLWDYFGGSSPRVRGRDGNKIVDRVTRRIIPAGAGKRLFAEVGEGLSEDHPRGCGEELPLSPPRASPQGSSPRVRGRGHARPRTQAEAGIIPAGAGKRRSSTP